MADATATAVPTHCKACSERIGTPITRIPLQYTTRRADGTLKQVNAALYLCSDCTAALVNTAQAAATTTTTVDSTPNYPIGKNIGAHGIVDVPASANATADMWLARLFGKRAEKVDPKTKAWVEGVFHENTKPKSFERLMRREVRFVVETAIALDDNKDNAGKEARSVLLGKLPREAANLLSERFQQSSADADGLRSTFEKLNAAWIGHVDAVFAKSQDAVKTPSDSELAATLPNTDMLLDALRALGPFSQADDEALQRTLSAYVQSTHDVVRLLAEPMQTSRSYLFPPLLRKAVEDGMAFGVQMDRATGGRV